ncbi:MAG: amylo-alpha-1,6-glucosidase [Hyphomonadaceae bacterium]
MRRRYLLVAAASTGALSVLPKGAQATSEAAQSFPVLESLAMPVSAAENRQYSFTDKASAYFYGRTHQDKADDWFFGWNVATKRIFQDYRLLHNGTWLRRADANVVVSPHAITRDYGQVKETLRLFDGLTALHLDVETALPGTLVFDFEGDIQGSGTAEKDGVWFQPKEAPASWLLVAPVQPSSHAFGVNEFLAIQTPSAGFFILLGASKAEVRRNLSQLRRTYQSLTLARMARMEALVSGSRALDAGDPDRTKALLWMRLTADQLVMKQMGTGIYAGLPWFNDYWGRDTFISITGTLFVTGQYDVAADVFRSFAALQDIDPKSKTYGRIPNRARPDGVQYNTADGTPRFIITLADLVQRTGNHALAKEMWPTVERAIEGMLDHDLDTHGLVAHGDADTWMDAKEKGVRAYSPRGNRAIDIQVLWLEAIETVLASSGFILANPVLMTRALDAMGSISKGLADKFVDKATGKLVDHLKPDGSPDLALRPNAFFALETISKVSYRDEIGLASHVKQKLLWARDLWKGLVYPWGVATLSQEDAEFHPYHEHWHYYHKDAAYHNGTVWPWLNGVAMTTLLRYGVQKEPWQLFENMNRQALREGAVGSLAECADALPVPGATWARRTGTFLQAWSNAEQLRVWHEEILGVRIRGGGTEVLIEPQLPKSVLNVSMNTPLKKGVLKGHWHRSNAHTWAFELQGADAVLLFSTDAAGQDWVRWPIKAGQRVEIIEDQGRLKLTAYDHQNRVIGETISGLDKLVDGDRSLFEAQRQQQEAFESLRDEVFKDLGFCEPRLQPNLKSLSVYHDPPLTY